MLSNKVNRKTGWIHSQCRNETHNVWVQNLIRDILVEKKSVEYKVGVVPISSLGFKPARSRVPYVVENEKRVWVWVCVLWTCAHPLRSKTEEFI